MALVNQAFQAFVTVQNDAEAERRSDQSARPRTGVEMGQQFAGAGRQFYAD